VQKIKLNHDLYALVDDEDYERVEAFGNWRTVRRGNHFYACHEKRIGPRWRNQRIMTLLHRFVLNVTDSKVVVDHINGDGLDCQKVNLVAGDRSLNGLNRVFLASNNTSGVTGVYWSTQKEKWHAEIHLSTGKIHVGFFDNIEDAQTARKERLKQLCTYIL
jgi:hypothetical protein